MNKVGNSSSELPVHLDASKASEIQNVEILTNPDFPTNPDEDLFLF